jgi:hypothetical protein
MGYTDRDGWTEGQPEEPDGQTGTRGMDGNGGSPSLECSASMHGTHSETVGLKSHPEEPSGVRHEGDLLGGGVGMVVV